MIYKILTLIKATFVALELKSKGYDAMCVTLAAPKIGDRDFVTLASKLGPKMIRLVRTNDPLPKLSPLKILLQGCGEEVQIGLVTNIHIYSINSHAGGVLGCLRWRVVSVMTMRFNLSYSDFFSDF